MKNKVCLVTGASSGMGKETAQALCSLGATVLLVVRDHTRGEQVVAQMKALTPQGKTDLFVADLSLQKDVRRVAGEIKKKYDRIDVLIHNAAVAPFQRRVTQEGIEETFATNYLAPFLLTHLLLDVLKKSASSRVVVISSEIHKLVKTISWDNLQAEKKYSFFMHYASTKLLNMLFTYQLAKRLAGTGIMVNCVSPLSAKTNLEREAQGFFKIFMSTRRLFSNSAKKAAETAIYVASSPEVEGISGCYFKKSKPIVSSLITFDELAQERLWKLSEKLVNQ